MAPDLVGKLLHCPSPFGWMVNDEISSSPRDARQNVHISSYLCNPTDGIFALHDFHVSGLFQEEAGYRVVSGETG